MNWEEIIISNLRNNENLDLTLKKAAKTAPEEIALVLRNFPENVDEIADKLQVYPKVISLLYFDFFAALGDFSYKFPLEHQKTILEFSIDASLRASSLANELGEKGLEASYWRMAGNSFYRIRKFSEAERAYTEALKTYRSLEKEKTRFFAPDVAKTLNNLGNVYINTKKFFEAEKVFSEALEKYRTLAEEKPKVYTSDVATTLNNFGVLYINTKKFFEAEKAYIEALEKYRTLAEERPEIYLPDVAAALNNLGNLYWNTQKYSQAEKAYIEALEMRRELAEEKPKVYTSDVATTLNNLGNLYINTKKFFEAEKVFSEALEKYRTLAEERPEIYLPDVAMVLKGLGNLYWNTKKFSQAEKAYTKALEIYRTLSKENLNIYALSVIKTLNDIGVFYNDIKKFFEAEKAFSEALEKYRTLAEERPEIYLPDVAAALNNLGNLYWNTQKYSQAEKAYIEALEMRRELAEEKPKVYTSDVATTLNNLGNLYINTKKFFEAEKVFSEALEKYRTLAEEKPKVYTSDVATTLNNLGNLYRHIERLSDAEKMYKEALEKYKKELSWFHAAKTTHNLFRIKIDKEILDESRKLLELAILFSKEEKYKYVQKGMSEDIYLSLFKEDISTFDVLESLRDSEILSLPWGQILTQEELQKAQIDVEFQKCLVEDILKRKSPYWKSTSRLPRNLAFIYIQKYKDYPFFFVIEGDRPKKFKCKRKFLLIGIKLLYLLIFQQITVGKMCCRIYMRKFEELAKQWYEILPQELKNIIQGKNYVVFSPDYFCSYFPLEALQVDGEPLCLEKSVVRATSLHRFSRHLTKKPSFDSSLIVGNPWPQCTEETLIYTLPSNSDQFKIPFLRGAQEEAKALMGNLPSATVLLGQNATGEKFLSEVPKHSLIHYSGHGSMGRILFLSGPLQGFPPLFEPEEFSNLRKAERNDGVRTINMMEEWHPITDLDLFDVKLTDGSIIFLNACETGQHKYAGGGYYQGLPAVFLKNGAHSVVSSLVPIFDNHSKEFALHFYDTLLCTHSVATALKKAREHIRDTYKAHIYWIPYVHYGPPL